MAHMGIDLKVLLGKLFKDPVGLYGYGSRV